MVLDLPGFLETGVLSNFQKMWWFLIYHVVVLDLPHVFALIYPLMVLDLPVSVSWNL